MRVTIITSCYNREATVCDAIRSVLRQDYYDIEYIIVDGNSTDGSQRMIENCIREATGNVQVKYITEPDHGMYEAINKGIRMATGDIIALCHSDDFIYDNHVVSDFVHEFERTGADFVYADGLFVDAVDVTKPVRKWIGGRFSVWKVKHGWLPLHPTCYIRRELMERLGLYDEQYKIAADTDLLVRYLLHDGVKVKYMANRFVTRMRMGGMSTDSAKRRKMWQEDMRVYRGHGFRFVTLTKIEKIMWKIPQFVLAWFM